MPDNFISLKCQSCGASLEIYDDMTRFACGYCKTEMLVERRGGTVALRAVEAAIKRVQVGTDKTAAELAITRYEGELKELRTKKAELGRRVSNSNVVFVCGVLALVVGIVALNEAQGVGAFLLAFGVYGVIARFLDRPKNRREQIQARIRTLESQLADKRAIVDS